MYSAVRNFLRIILILLASDHGLVRSADAGDSAGPPPRGSKIHFDHASGIYASAFSLSLSTPLAGTEIYFTTNGAAPTRSAGIRYQEPVPVNTTLVVRAAAFAEETAVTDFAARSYLFPQDILRQTGATCPRTWGVSEGKPVPAHYTLSPALAEGPARRQVLIEALKALPSLSITTDPENLFDSTAGIYTHPQERGSEWERPASVEWINPDERAGFSFNCGLRIHGSSSRQPEVSPKHSFRLVCRKRYGAPKLRFPVFGPGGGVEVDELILRAGNNDSWLHTSGEERARAVYLRDEWMRRSMLALDYPSARGAFVHLYLNGLYWGLYNVCEPPAAVLPALASGRNSVEFDSRKADRIESGDRTAWNRMMELANAGLAEPAPYQAISQCLDLDEFADFMLLNLFAGNSDWDRSANWYAVRPRLPGGRFRFFVWDAEGALGGLEANTLDFDDDDSPPRLFQKLSENAAFRRLFAERARRLLLDNGPLAAGPAARRFRELVQSIEPAIVAESARWGDYRRNVHSYKTGPFEQYTPEAHWRPEIDRLLTHYFPERPALVLQQFRARGLCP